MCGCEPAKRLSCCVRLGSGSFVKKLQLCSRDLDSIGQPMHVVDIVHV